MSALQRRYDSFHGQDKWEALRKFPQNLSGMADRAYPTTQPEMLAVLLNTNCLSANFINARTIDLFKTKLYDHLQSLHHKMGRNNEHQLLSQVYSMFFLFLFNFRDPYDCRET